MGGIAGGLGGLGLPGWAAVAARGASVTACIRSRSTGWSPSSRKLPGIGQRTAQRLAFHLLRAEDDEALALADAIREVKEKVGLCEVCFNLAEGPRCRICEDKRRDRSLICVVEEPADVIPIERTGEYRGLYHVLGGALSPIDGIDPEDLKIAELLAARGRRDVRRSCSRPTRRRPARRPRSTSPRRLRDQGHGHPPRQRPAGRRRPRARRRGHPRQGARRGAARPHPMPLLDLSAPIRPDPPEMLELIRTDIEFEDHAAGADAIETLFGLGTELLKDGEGWATETFTRFGTHNSTHVDAPYHYNSTIGGKPAQRIDELPLEWFLAPGVVIDATDRADGEALDAAEVESRLPRPLAELDIVLVRTGRDAFYGQPTTWPAGLASPPRRPAGSTSRASG